MLMLAAFALMWSCSSDDDDPEVVDPVNFTETQLTPGNDERPSWTKPDYRQFQQTMTVQVRLQEALSSYITAQDLLCAKVDSVIGAVTVPNESETGYYFPLSIATDKGDAMISIHYYCDSLHRIFSIENWRRYDESASPLDEDNEPYLLEFITSEKSE